MVYASVELVRPFSSAKLNSYDDKEALKVARCAFRLFSIDVLPNRHRRFNSPLFRRGLLAAHDVSSVSRRQER